MILQKDKLITILTFFILNIFCLVAYSHALTKEGIDLFNQYYTEANKLLKPYMILDDVDSKDPTTADAKKDINKSIELYSKALEIHHKSWQSYWSMGKAYQALNQIDKAYVCFKNANSIMSNNPDVANEYLRAAIELDKIKEAIAIAQEAVKTFPKHVGLNANYGLALLLDGQVDKAYSVTKRALRLNPKDTITKNVLELIKQVKSGKRSCPKTISDLD